MTTIPFVSVKEAKLFMSKQENQKLYPVIWEMITRHWRMRERGESQYMINPK